MFHHSAFLMKIRLRFLLRTSLHTVHNTNKRNPIWPPRSDNYCQEKNTITAIRFKDTIYHKIDAKYSRVYLLVQVIKILHYNTACFPSMRHASKQNGVPFGGKPFLKLRLRTTLNFQTEFRAMSLSLAKS